MIYRVTVRAPAVDEDLTTAAPDPEQAKIDAVNSAMQRWMRTVEVTVEEAPDA